MRKRLFLLILLTAIMLNCGVHKGPSQGEWNNIVVFSEDRDWTEVQENFSSVFEREIITPQIELVYKLYRNPIANHVGSRM